MNAIGACQHVLSYALRWKLKRVVRCVVNTKDQVELNGKETRYCRVAGKGKNN
jgi:hypothetical protein